MGIAMGTTGGHGRRRIGLVLAGVLLLCLIAAVAWAEPSAAALPTGGTQAGHVLFVQGDSVMDIALSTGARQRLRRIPGADTPGSPYLSRNGKGMAYVLFDDKGIPYVEYQETLTAAPGQVTTHPPLGKALDGTGVLPDPSVAPGGGRVLYTVEDVDDPGGGFLPTVEIYDAFTRSVIDRIPQADVGDWSPLGGAQGRYIAYLSYIKSQARADHVGLFIYDTLNRTSQPVPGVAFTTPGEVDLYSPRYSPDAQWIAYIDVDASSDVLQVRMTRTDGSANQLVAQYQGGGAGLGLRWVTLGGVNLLLLERIEQGGGPEIIDEILPGFGGKPVRRVLHGTFGPRIFPEFADVSASDPNARVIRGLSVLGIMQGFADGTFGAALPVRRMQYAKIISVAKGLHDAAWTGWSTPAFADVPRPPTQTGGARYPFDYVQEAFAAGLVRGKADGLFHPSDDINRVQLALMIARAGKGVFTPATAADYAAFTDTAALSQEAKDAIALCYHNGVIKGKTADHFAPYSNATRGHVALMTWRYMRVAGWVLD